MTAISNYLENKLIDHLFRDTTFAKPAALYWALFTVAPTDAGGGTEVSGGSYARVNVAPSLTNYKGTHGTTTGASSGTTGLTSNAVEILFPAPTADWGTVVHIGVFDALTGGNLLIHFPLASNKVVSSGEVTKFNADDFTFALD